MEDTYLKCRFTGISYSMLIVWNAIEMTGFEHYVYWQFLVFHTFPCGSLLRFEELRTQGTHPGISLMALEEGECLPPHIARLRAKRIGTRRFWRDNRSGLYHCTLPLTHNLHYILSIWCIQPVDPIFTSLRDQSRLFDPA